MGATMFFWKTVKTILVIDDDRTLLRQLTIHLNKYKNVEVIAHENAVDGLAAASTVRPNLIILDWTLPDVEGIDVLQTLKRSSKTKTIPVLMLTGHNKIGNIEDAFKKGAEAYIVKPFSLEKLAEKSFSLMKDKRKIKKN